jgi:hypothetical protein
MRTKFRMFARVASVSRFSSARTLPSPSMVATKIGTVAARGAGVLTLTGLGLATLGSVSSCDAPAPAFTSKGDRYDQSQYMGRLRTIWEIVDMRTLLVDDAELGRCQALLAEFEARGGISPGSLPTETTDDDMWYAKKTIDAVIHKPTGEKMSPAIGRMSGFVLVNMYVRARFGRQLTAARHNAQGVT